MLKQRQSTRVRINCDLLLVNKQVYGEALPHLLRDSIRVSDLYLTRQRTTVDPAVKERLTYILENFVNLNIELPHLDRFAWYMKILTERDNLNSIYFHFHDRNARLVYQWRKDRATAERQFRILEDIKVRKGAVMIFTCPTYVWQYPPHEMMSTAAEMQAWFNTTVAAKMKGGK